MDNVGNFHDDIRTSIDDVFEYLTTFQPYSALFPHENTVNPIPYFPWTTSALSMENTMNGQKNLTEYLL